MSLCGGKQLKTKKESSLGPRLQLFARPLRMTEVGFDLSELQLRVTGVTLPFTNIFLWSRDSTGSFWREPLVRSKGKLRPFSMTTVTPAWSAGPCNHTLQPLCYRLHTPGSFRVMSACQKCLIWTHSNLFHRHVVYSSVIREYWEQSINISLHSDISVWFGIFRNTNE